MTTSMTRLTGVFCALVLVVASVITWASPAVGVTPTLIERGTYEPFKVKMGAHSLVDVEMRYRRQSRTRANSAVSSPTVRTSTGGSRTRRWHPPSYDIAHLPPIRFDCGVDDSLIDETRPAPCAATAAGRTSSTKVS